MTIKFFRMYAFLMIAAVLLSVECRAQADVPADRSTDGPPAFPIRLTLDEARKRATAGPLERLAQLTVDSAKYHRQAAEGDYFPKVAGTFANLHFNKFMGETIQPFRRSIGIPLLSKDQTIAAFTVMQPLTPLLKVREVVKIAKADEAIARAKAAKMLAQTSNDIDKAYYAFLIADRQRSVAEAKVNRLESEIELASVNGGPMSAAIAERQEALAEANRELASARNKVVELGRPLNKLLGMNPDTRLELSVPAPLEANDVSLAAATTEAMDANPEIIEAEQTVIKARAATRLSKLDYIPDVAIVGGYVYQNAIDLLPHDFSYVGVMATYNLFDGFKRENTLKERKANLEMAQINVEVVKAKVAGSVQTSYLDMERTRKIRDLARQVVLLYQKGATAQPASFEETDARAKAEIEMLQSELELRLAYAKLQGTVTGH